MTIAILGAGAMGGALLAGLIQSGWDKAELRVGEARPERQRELVEQYGVTAGPAIEAARGADVVVVVVKPQDVAGLLDEVGPLLGPGALVVSLAAGVTIAALEAHLPAGWPVVRVMPNTPALVGAAMSVICGGTAAGAGHLAQAERLLAGVGQVLTVPEKYFDAVTAVSGSGPAYVMYVAEAMIDAGVLLGLPRPTATELVKQTLFGSAKLLLESGQHPTVLKETVTSPGGTTAAALRAFEDHGVKAAFIDAMAAAARRSAELGQPSAS